MIDFLQHMRGSWMSDTIARRQMARISIDLVQTPDWGIIMQTSRSADGEYSLNLAEAIRADKQTLDLAQVPEIKLSVAWGWQGEEINLTYLSEQLMGLREDQPELVEVILQGIISHIPTIIRWLDQEGERKHREETDMSPAAVRRRVQSSGKLILLS